MKVRRVSERVVAGAVLVFQEVLRLICGYAQQGGINLEEKTIIL